jgi:hypothetical protein
VLVRRGVAEVRGAGGGAGMNFLTLSVIKAESTADFAEEQAT